MNINNHFSDIKVSNCYMILFNINWLKLGPLKTESVFFSFFGTFFYLFNEWNVWFFSCKLKSFESCLSRDYIFLIINYFVFNVKNKFFNLFSFFFSLFKNFILFISVFFLIIAVDEISVDWDEQINRVIFLDKINKLDNFLKDNFSELFDGFYLREFILKFALVKKIFQNSQIKWNKFLFLDWCTNFFDEH